MGTETGQRQGGGRWGQLAGECVYCMSSSTSARGGRRARRDRARDRGGCGAWARRTERGCICIYIHTCEHTCVHTCTHIYPKRPRRGGCTLQVVWPCHARRRTGSVQSQPLLWSGLPPIWLAGWLAGRVGGHWSDSADELGWIGLGWANGAGDSLASNYRSGLRANSRLHSTQAGRQAGRQAGARVDCAPVQNSDPVNGKAERIIAIASQSQSQPNNNSAACAESQLNRDPQADRPAAPARMASRRRAAKRTISMAPGRQQCRRPE